ncbi:unnamed protein product, partial [Effrenium voratum]
TLREQRLSGHQRRGARLRHRGLRSGRLGGGEHQGEGRVRRFRGGRVRVFRCGGANQGRGRPEAAQEG